jgi:hypothetical protein
LSYHGQTDVWQSYRTDGLPRGLPGGGVLRLSETTTPALFARFGEQGIANEPPQHYSAEQLARRLSLRPGDERSNSYNILSIQPEVNTAFLFRFDFPDETTTTMRLNSFRSTSPAVRSIEDLPEPLRSQVKAALKQLGP